MLFGFNGAYFHFCDLNLTSSLRAASSFLLEMRKLWVTWVLGSTAIINESSFTLKSLANVFVIIVIKIYFKTDRARSGDEVCIPLHCALKEIIYSNRKAYSTPSKIVY